MLKNIKVSGKIALMVAIVVLPLIAAVVYATVKGLNKDINFALQEKKGNVFERPLESLLVAIPQNQWLAEAVARGNHDAETQLAANSADIDHLLNDLQEVSLKYGDELGFTQEGLAKAKRQNMDARSLSAAWQKLKQEQPQLTVDASALQHHELTAVIREMISHSADNSNLTLDPDLDSFYVMDMTTVALPQTQSRIAEITSFACNVLRGGKESVEDARQLSTYAVLLNESDVSRIKTDADTALARDADFYGTCAALQSGLPDPLKSYEVACANFSALVGNVIADPTKVSADEFLAAGQNTLKAAHKLWLNSSEDLEILLQTRASSLQIERYYTLVTVAIGLLVSIYFAVLLSRGITRPLASLTGTAQKILQGDNEARAVILAQDELGMLAKSFNAMVEGRIQAQAVVENENKRLQASIQELLVVVSNASDGKLGVRAKVTEGALGNVADALNLMLENVGELIANAKTASNQVATAASGITTVTQELEKGEKRQSTEISATSDGVRDLNDKAQRVLANCRSATSAADDARRAAEDGAKAVKEVIKGMEKIRDNTQVNAKKIKRLGDRSMEIAGIVKIITDISAKTDMLSLNASIEAARAGEQGRGFTVVAEQVRGLADRTRTLTNQIEKLVGDIQQETSEAVAQMESQTQEVEVGARAAEAAGATLENIVSVSSESSELVSEINKAATQQAERTKEMLAAVESITRVAAEAQVRVQETRTTSEQLANLSGELNKKLAQFEVEVITA